MRQPGAAASGAHPTAPVMPSALRRLWVWWKAVGARIGDFQARVVLTLCYFLVIPPFAWIVRWTTDPLAIKRGTARGWRYRPDPTGTALERAMRQY